MSFLFVIHLQKACIPYRGWYQPDGRLWRAGGRRRAAGAGGDRVSGKRGARWCRPGGRRRRPASSCRVRGGIVRGQRHSRGAPAAVARTAPSWCWPCRRRRPGAEGCQLVDQQLVMAVADAALRAPAAIACPARGVELSRVVKKAISIASSDFATTLSNQIYDSLIDERVERASDDSRNQNFISQRRRPRR